MVYRRLKSHTHSQLCLLYHSLRYQCGHSPVPASLLSSFLGPNTIFTLCCWLLSALCWAFCLCTCFCLMLVHFQQDFAVSFPSVLINTQLYSRTNCHGIRLHPIHSRPQLVCFPRSWIFLLLLFLQTPTPKLTAFSRQNNLVLDFSLPSLSCFFVQP